MKNHEDIIELLVRHGGELLASEFISGITLCRIVYDGDNALLKRFLIAKIQVNATDYDKRTAAHIAASEGNLGALKLLVEAGADLSLKDRWGNNVRSEAEMSNAGKVLEYLDSLDALM
jgi:glutaminase